MRPKDTLECHKSKKVLIGFTAQGAIVYVRLHFPTHHRVKAKLYTFENRRGAPC
jgi:hypothetical protein